MIKYIALAVAALLVGVDQWVKAWAYSGLTERITVIPGIFYLTYLENTGAAFGLFQGRAFTLGIVSIAILAVVLYLLLSDRVKGRTLIWGLSLVFAGGVGNLIDRLALFNRLSRVDGLTQGFVIDYLDFSALLNFPIFNLADCFVVIGTVIMMVQILFFEGKKPVTEGTEPVNDPPETEDTKISDSEQTGENS